MDNIALGPDGQANHALAVLRQEAREGELSESVHFLPGVDLYADPSLGLTGRYSSPEGRILELDAHTSGQGNWCGFHVRLPAAKLDHVGSIGFAVRIAAPEVFVARAALRSGGPEGFVDCFFDKHLLFRPEEASHVDAIPVHYREPVPMEAAWRELIFFLPTSNFRLSFVDLRLFVV
ncbi:MAG: hypothetical protein AAGF50_14255 [Pseudomonadota bacterium]